MIKKLTSQSVKQEEFNERTAQWCTCQYMCDPDKWDRYELKMIVLFV